MMRRIYYFLVDAIDRLLGRRDEFTPPKRLAILAGGGNFKEIGEEFFRYFIDLASLKPSESVLDVGCGVGRMAVPLTSYLDQRGRYEGFDIVAAEIHWCQKAISSKYPNFHFQLADIINTAYNPYGKFKAAEYTFPFGDETFDFVFLTSVFTHMLPQDMKNYFGEVTRVLKTGGRCLITFFLLNEESNQQIKEGKSTLAFRYDQGECRIVKPEAPETVVAYPEALVLGLYELHRLRITQPIGYGYWCGRSNFLSYQDIIVASKQ